MDAKQINQTFDLVSYVGGIVKLHKAGAYWVGPCPICGGRDRFNIKRAGGAGDLWICRKCASDKYHSPIDLIMQLHNLDFKQALASMGGDTLQPAPGPRIREPREPAPIQIAPDPTWQAQAWQLIDPASDRLIESEEGEPGRRYLASRGISRGAMYMHLLGYEPAATKARRPAIVIPWLDQGDTVTAVKYRFIDDLARTDKGKRFAMLAGSLPCLFGLQHILPGDETLLFVEGEINAISILQALPRGVSVVSAGSESNGKEALIHALARRYEKIIIWMDDPAKAATMRGRMARDATLIKSPMIDGLKYDANQMLQAGVLFDFISRQLATECLGIPAPAVFTAAKVEA